MRFAPDEALRASATGVELDSVDAALDALFGSPDQPRLPRSTRIGELLQIDRLRQAAGPVISHTPGVTQGLYRRHCARCHGITGDGRGPTARYQAPYPRDFRRGVFKWKSTYRAAPPTSEDLHATIEQGVPGTAMPSFRLLSQDERETLRQYVVYLAIRGQAERALMDFAESELPLDAPVEVAGARWEIFLDEWLEPILVDWAEAADRVVTPNENLDPPIEADRITLGRKLYHSERTGCYKCHGPQGQGGAVAGADYEIGHDVWTVVDNPTGAELLPARPAKPREILGSTLRGGSRRIALWRRLHQGIAGVPMPGVGSIGPGEAGALTDDEVTSLTIYVETLLADTPAEVAAR